MAGALTIDTLNASSGPLAIQNGMSGIVKAWASFASDGTINGSFNVSSISQTLTGHYTINFTTSLSDANYAVSGSCIGNNNGGVVVLGTSDGILGSKLSSSFQIFTSVPGLATYDGVFNPPQTNIIVCGI
jgi:hypothetical protein